MPYVGTIELLRRDRALGQGKTIRRLVDVAMVDANIYHFLTPKAGRKSTIK
jgi:hypothetical protein